VLKKIIDTKIIILKVKIYFDGDDAFSLFSPKTIGMAGTGLTTDDTVLNCNLISFLPKFDFLPD
jgi:hypothetical protein